MNRFARFASALLTLLTISSVIAAPAAAQSIGPITPANPIRFGHDLMVNGQRHQRSLVLDRRRRAAHRHHPLRDGSVLLIACAAACRLATSSSRDRKSVV